MPRRLGTSQLVRAASRPWVACLAPLVHTFWPLTTHSSPSRSARVCTAARSDPAPGSLYSRQVRYSPVSSLRSTGPRSSGDSAKSLMAFEAMALAVTSGTGAPAAVNSSAMTRLSSSGRSRPNMSRGHDGRAHPASTTSSVNCAAILPG